MPAKAESAARALATGRRKTAAAVTTSANSAGMSLAAVRRRKAAHCVCLAESAKASVSATGQESMAVRRLADVSEMARDNVVPSEGKWRDTYQMSATSFIRVLSSSRTWGASHEWMETGPGSKNAGITRALRQIMSASGRQLSTASHGPGHPEDRQQDRHDDPADQSAKQDDHDRLEHGGDRLDCVLQFALAESRDLLQDLRQVATSAPPVATICATVLETRLVADSGSANRWPACRWASARSHRRAK